MHWTRLGWLGATALLMGAASPQKKPMLLPEMLKLMDASKVKYTINELPKAKLPDDSPEALLKLLYPQQVPVVELPQVVEGPGGERIIRPAPCDAAQPLIRKAEMLFQSKNYDAAAAVYDEAIAKAPRCYLAEAYRGDASHFAGDYKAALAHYDKALALNPDDGAIWLFRANALARLGKLKESADSLRWSLALRPRNENVLKMLAGAAHTLGVRVNYTALAPRSFARKEADGIGIYNDPSASGWLGYGICKGLWLGEPAHRKQLTGSEALTFGTPEEGECIIALVDDYEIERHDPKKPAAADPAIDRIETVFKDGYGSAWIVYELLSRVDPQIVLRLPKAERQQVFDYVKRYVVVDVQ